MNEKQNRKKLLLLMGINWPLNDLFKIHKKYLIILNNNK